MDTKLYEKKLRKIELLKKQKEKYEKKCKELESYINPKASLAEYERLHTQLIKYEDEFLKDSVKLVILLIGDYFYSDIQKKRYSSEEDVNTGLYIADVEFNANWYDSFNFCDFYKCALTGDKFGCKSKITVEPYVSKNGYDFTVVGSHHKYGNGDDEEATLSIPWDVVEDIPKFKKLIERRVVESYEYTVCKV